MQYAVQCRADQATITIPHQVARWAVRGAGNAGVESLLDLSEDEWRRQAGRGKSPAYPAFLLFARDMVEELAEGTGWEAECPRDIWRLHRIPGLVLNPGKPANSRIRLRFDRLAQPWLRDLSKRWDPAAAELGPQRRYRAVRCHRPHPVQRVPCGGFTSTISPSARVSAP